MRIPIALLAGLLVAGPAPSHAAEESRADVVLGVLQQTFHAPPGPHFNTRDVLLTAIEKRPAQEAGRPLHVPVLPPHCGTGMQYGGLDPTATLALAERLFGAYGYTLETGHGVEVGGRRLPIDRLDEKGKVGFLLLPAPLGGAEAPLLPWGEAAGPLRERGLCVLAIPLPSFRCLQADDLTPLLACGLSILDFLNDVTGGDDVDVEALATGRRIELPLPALDAGRLPRTSSVQAEAGALFFVAEGRGTVTLAFEPPSGSVRKGVGLVVLPFAWTPPLENGAYDFDRPGPRFLLLQGTLRVESHRAIFVTPPTFDTTKPFRVRIDYVEGQVHLGSPLTLRVP